MRVRVTLESMMLASWAVTAPMPPAATDNAECVLLDFQSASLPCKKSRIALTALSAPAPRLRTTRVALRIRQDFLVLCSGACSVDALSASIFTKAVPAVVGIRSQTTFLAFSSDVASSVLVLVWLNCCVLGGSRVSW
mmetsp:Transcript_5735/g.14923  ORF Transcript_5735/g.14923 Transcript_5735/m.14923 type:complete len:137 (-) Transcript_5735:14-424(-)